MYYSHLIIKLSIVNKINQNGFKKIFHIKIDCSSTNCLTTFFFSINFNVARDIKFEPNNFRFHFRRNIFNFITIVQFYLLSKVGSERKMTDEQIAQMKRIWVHISHVFNIDLVESRKPFDASKLIQLNPGN